MDRVDSRRQKLGLELPQPKDTWKASTRRARESVPVRKIKTCSMVTQRVECKRERETSRDKRDDTQRDINTGERESA